MVTLSPLLSWGASLWVPSWADVCPPIVTAFESTFIGDTTRQACGHQGRAQGPATTEVAHRRTAPPEHQFGRGASLWAPSWANAGLRISSICALAFVGENANHARGEQQDRDVLHYARSRGWA